MSASEAEKGYFKGKIGKGLQAMYGQSFQINVKELSGKSCELGIQCEVYHQIVDYGRNTKMITKFNTELARLIDTGTV